MRRESSSGFFISKEGWRMQVAYIKGEKVYVEEIVDLNRDREPSWFPCSGTVQILTQRELIRVLTKIIEDADQLPVGKAYGSGPHADLARIVVEANAFSHNKDHKFKIEYVDPRTLKFDNPNTVRKQRRAKLPKVERGIIYDGPKVIPGGLLPAPSDKKGKPVGDIVSPQFKAWKKGQKGEPEQPII